MTNNKARLVIVGAGPGAPDLISLRGIRELAAADVVLYDALVNIELLDYVPSTALKIYVGKRPGSKKNTQRTIHDLILKYGVGNCNIVRLKGGDPFVFGRGAEELRFATENGMETAVVPGISSALAVPANLNIPLTHRGIAESFWVVTATTVQNKFASDLKLVAQSSATAVILMGMRKIEQICSLFSENGKEQTPAAVIQNGTTNSQKWVVAPVNQLAQRADEAGLGSPAIIIIGQVVKQQQDLVQLIEHIKRRGTDIQIAV